MSGSAQADHAPSCPDQAESPFWPRKLFVQSNSDLALSAPGCVGAVHARNLHPVVHGQVRARVRARRARDLRPRHRHGHACSAALHRRVGPRQPPRQARVVERSCHRCWYARPPLAGIAAITW
eukprot:3215831-Rhodomonas_salina.5